ncbi:hypothetical protein QJS64_12865 [Paraclostridium bifermentans]|uniref:Core-binding (CB) domain-containing protein n=1 Tax=Paraclostridium bifermentans TaxID=1490 RepID=A0ABY8R1W0_PARBF|nr:hypothetical protein QJS64_12865 [Paraclostridium bifermentans]
MYKYLDEVQEITDKMIDAFGINIKKAAPFYRRRINNFFKNYMGLEENKFKPLDALTYYDIEIYIKKLECSDAEKVNIYNSLKRFLNIHTLKERQKRL